MGKGTMAGAEEEGVGLVAEVEDIVEEVVVGLVAAEDVVEEEDSNIDGRRLHTAHGYPGKGVLVVMNRNTSGILRM